MIKYMGTMGTELLHIIEMAWQINKAPENWKGG